MDPDPYLSVFSQILSTIDSTQNLIITHPPTIGSIVALLIAVLALCASAFVSGSEVAFFSLTDHDIEEIDDEHKQKSIRKVLEKPEQLLATILITNNLVNISIVILCNYAMGRCLSFVVKLPILSSNLLY